MAVKKTFLVLLLVLLGAVFIIPIKHQKKAIYGVGPLNCSAPLASNFLNEATYIILAEITHVEAEDDLVWEINISPKKIWKGDEKSIPKSLLVERYIETSRSEEKVLEDNLKPSKEYVFFLKGTGYDGRLLTGRCNPYFSVDSPEIEFLKNTKSQNINQ